jgi:hypothetical protein
VWVIRVRTTANADGVVARRVVGSKAMPWNSLKGLRLTKRAGVRAVLADDTEVTLPCVRVRHLPALALVSGGRLDDPTETPVTETEKDATEEAAAQPTEPAVEAE